MAQDFAMVSAEWIRKLITTGGVHAFYVCGEWQRLRKEVLAADKYECQRCKANGKYTRATTVHHVNYVKRHPELALSKDYIDRDGETRRQLLSLCHHCHEEVHGYRQKEKQKPLTEEQW